MLRFDAPAEKATDDSFALGGSMNMKSSGAMRIEANMSNQSVVNVETLEVDGYSKKSHL